MWSLFHYGHRNFYSLHMAQGHLCHRFWAAKEIAKIILFSQAKEAVKWLEKANKAAVHRDGSLRWPLLKAQPHILAEIPDTLGVAIDPADDTVSIGIIMKNSFWLDW